jgi:hypothetical protein
LSACPTYHKVNEDDMNLEVQKPLLKTTLNSPSR